MPGSRDLGQRCRLQIECGLGEFLAHCGNYRGKNKVTEKHRIAVVDDNPVQQVILLRLLSESHEVVCFDNGSAFLTSPDAFDVALFDIEMPGPSGYEICRALRSRPDNNDTPVIFVSAHDTVPDRVAAYEAGGDDFIAKPISVHELRHKVNTIIEHRDRLRELSTQSSTAQQIAFTAMTSMGDLGVVIEFLRKCTCSNSYESTARQLAEAMSAWGLRGAVQVRGPRQRLNVSTDGEMSPLQSSVLENLQDIGRIFELGSRAVINYEHVSLLVQNLPTSDPDKVGRLRDHLAALAESADIHLASIDAIQERDLQKLGIEGTLAELRNALEGISSQTHQHRLAGQAHIMEQLEYLGRTLQSLGLSSSQESFVSDLVRESLDTALNFFDEAAHYEDQFAEVATRLERLAASDYRL